MSRREKRAHKQFKNELTKGIFTVLESDRDKSYNYKQIASKLGLTDTKSRNELIKRLGKLKNEKRILEVETGKYKAIVKKNYYQGTLDLTSSGNGYVILDDMNEDVYIPSHSINKAFDKDFVEVYIFPRRKHGRNPEGEITKILERKKTTFVGQLAMEDKFGFVRPSDSKMQTDFYIPLENVGTAKNGELVIVELADWPKKADSPIGKIIEVLGQPGEHETEMHAILAEYGLPYDFPLEVSHYANQLDTSITKEEIKNRRDMRKTLTFTIDPKDAKDFDDALSFEVLEDGNFEVGVHIADVSYYIDTDSILEEEAYRRATSVYLVDRVVPMLPEILSNNACSLRPHEEKYTFSAVFKMNKDGQILNQWFGRTVTYSDARFSYEEAQVMIDTQSNKVPKTLSLTGEEYEVEAPIADAILQLNEVAKIMRERRMDAGAISFDKVEVKFDLNDKNEPIGVYFKSSKEANKLIEEFMLLANRKVAEYIGKQKKTFVYRIHDDPDEEKLMQLQGVISRFGYSLDMKSKKSLTQSLNSLLENVQGKKEQNLIDTLTIRTMSKAIYSTENIGHYGLGFNYYTHFTSPIRRYPDVMVHRLLQHYLDGGSAVEADKIERKCKHATDMEILATNAERDSIKYMQIKYMEDRFEDEFLGVISGVTEWGIYVEIIENKCEGMVRAQSLRDDDYHFDPKTFSMVGESTGKSYQLGDEVFVKMVSSDLQKRHLDFVITGKKLNN
ncbi:ribonuclease R [Galbibacter sp.]|jgi:ribonuclease R/exosome complex exonuclease DIS3/RRP44|uniref:ribonuclease R n=1 Tax=Galbibacter sp. TaxID=2918471 RepID=UPI003A9191C9